MKWGSNIKMKKLCFSKNSHFQLLDTPCFLYRAKLGIRENGNSGNWEQCKWEFGKMGFRKNGNWRKRELDKWEFGKMIIWKTDFRVTDIMNTWNGKYHYILKTKLNWYNN